MDFPDKPGIKIDHKEKSFWKTEPFRRSSPLNKIEKFVNYRSAADRKLPAGKIDGKQVEGFEIDGHKIDPDRESRGEKVRVWYDPKSMRPLKIEVERKWGEKRIIRRFDHFEWDVAVDDWFRVAAPKDYAEQRPTPVDVDEQTSLIVKGLEAYKKHFGRYPQVEMVYPDVCMDEIDAKQGEPNNQSTPDSRAAVEGFREMMGLQRHNIDCAYYGKIVGPKDKDRILFR